MPHTPGPARPGFQRRRSRPAAGGTGAASCRQARCCSSTRTCRPYECDGLSAYRQLPLAVVLAENEAQVVAVLKTCHALGVPVVARGAGTGLVGRRAAARQWRAAQPGEDEAHPARSIRWRAPPSSSPACATWPSPKRRRRTASTTRPIPVRRSPAPSAATWPRTPAACIA